MSDEISAHLEWIYFRLKNVHGENPNFDYMIKMRKAIVQVTRLEAELIAHQERHREAKDNFATIQRLREEKAQVQAQVEALQELMSEASLDDWFCQDNDDWLRRWNAGIRGDFDTLLEGRE